MKPGMVIRSKDSKEVAIVTEIGAFIRYRGSECEGEVRSDLLHEEFDVLLEPASQEDFEAILRAKIEAEEAETGLYDCGLSYVVVDRVDGQITFQWFDDIILLHNILGGGVR